MKTRLWTLIAFALARPADSDDGARGEPVRGRCRLTLSRGGFLLEEEGKEPRRFATLESLLSGAARLEGEFVMEGGPGKDEGHAAGKGRVIDAMPGRKGMKTRVEAGEISILDCGRFLADYSGLPVIIDSSDKALAERKITVPATIPSADYELVGKLLQTNHIRVTRSRTDGDRALVLLESMTAAAPDEPESHPVVLVSGGDASRGGGERRTAKGPEPKGKAFAGIVLVPVPDLVRAQVDLPEGRGMIVSELDESLSRARPDVSPLKLYDLVTHVNNVAVDSAARFASAINALAPGEAFQYRVLRKGITRILRAERSR